MTTRQRFLWMLVILAGAVLVVRAILDSEFRGSALLYVSVPFGVSVALHALAPHARETGWGRRYWNHLRDATIVFLGVSVLLMEGFICVLFFLPIYYVGVSVAFGALALLNKGGGARVQTALPLLLVGLAFGMEGVVPAATSERAETVVVTRTFDASPDEVWANIAVPPELATERHWFLRVFPLPDRVDAPRIVAGDTHVFGFTYRRWLVTNAHRGEMHVRIDEADGRRLRTTVTRNDSYLAHYLDISGTAFELSDLPGGQTELTLTVRYERKLDPAWYFVPLQRFAIEKSAGYFADTMIDPARAGA